MRRHKLTSLLFAMFLIAAPAFGCAKGEACCESGATCRGEMPSTANVTCCSGLPTRAQAAATAEISKNDSKHPDRTAASPPLHASRPSDERSGKSFERRLGARAAVAFASCGHRTYLDTGRLRL